MKWKKTEIDKKSKDGVLWRTLLIAQVEFLKKLKEGRKGAKMVF